MKKIAVSLQTIAVLIGFAIFFHAKENNLLFAFFALNILALSLYFREDRDADNRVLFKLDPIFIMVGLQLLGFACLIMEFVSRVNHL